MFSANEEYIVNLYVCCDAHAYMGSYIIGAYTSEHTHIHSSIKYGVYSRFILEQSLSGRRRERVVGQDSAGIELNSLKRWSPCDRMSRRLSGRARTEKDFGISCNREFVGR